MRQRIPFANDGKLPQKPVMNMSYPSGCKRVKVLNPLRSVTTILSCTWWFEVKVPLPNIAL